MNTFSSTSGAPKRRSLRHLLVLCVVLLGSAFYAFGQDATIVGTVTDPSGAAVPNVSITIVNTETGLSRQLTSNGEGQYVAPSLRIGHYTVRAEASGFKQVEQKGIVLAVGDRTRVDMKLEIGTTQEHVTVEANAIAVQSESGEVSDLITGQQITQLESNGRSLYSLSTLTPGASSLEADFQVPTPMGGDQNVSFNGQRVAHNLFTIDGAEAADRGGSGSIVMPSLDSVAEFRELTSNYSAEYGLSSSTTVTTVLKSGTKTLHASAWWFGRNDAFQARNYFKPRQNANGTLNKMPELRFNLWGFNVGGPVAIQAHGQSQDFLLLQHGVAALGYRWRSSNQRPFPSTYGGDLNQAITFGGLLNTGRRASDVPAASPAF